MANSPADDLASTLDRIERRESRRTKSVLLLTALPVVVALVALYGTTRVLIDYRGQIAEARTQIAEARAEQQRLQQTIEQLNKELRQTTDLSRFKHDINFAELKRLAGRYPGPAAYLTAMLSEQMMHPPKWKLGGRTPVEGFDSPGFASYLLRQSGVLQRELASSDDVVSSSALLRQSLAPTKAPRSGDLLFYEAGFAMFLFQDPPGKDFVIGMTPLGVIAADRRFATELDAVRTW